MKLNLTLNDNRELEIDLHNFAYLEDPEAACYRPWDSRVLSDENPALTPEKREGLTEIVKDI